MNLRKDQRHTVYIIMRAEIKSRTHRQFFIPLLETFSLEIEDLPELNNQRYWYASTKEGKARRLSILDNCIELTY